jgi:hypothetical protein
METSINLLLSKDTKKSLATDRMTEGYDHLWVQILLRNALTKSVGFSCLLLNHFTQIHSHI